LQEHYVHGLPRLQREEFLAQMADPFINTARLSVVCRRGDEIEFTGDNGVPIDITARIRKYHPHAVFGHLEGVVEFGKVYTKEYLYRTNAHRYAKWMEVVAHRLDLPYSCFFCFVRNFFKAVSGSMTDRCDAVCTRGLKYEGYEFDDGLARNQLIFCANMSHEGAGALLASARDNTKIRLFRWYNPEDAFAKANTAAVKAVRDAARAGSQCDKKAVDDAVAYVDSAVKNAMMAGKMQAIGAGYRYDGLFVVSSVTRFVDHDSLPNTRKKIKRIREEDVVVNVTSACELGHSEYPEGTVFRFVLCPAD
jgi:hypothetical protein